MRGSVKGEEERPKSTGVGREGGEGRVKMAEVCSRVGAWQGCCLTEMGLKEQEQVWWEKMEKMLGLRHVECEEPLRQAGGGVEGG